MKPYPHPQSTEQSIIPLRSKRVYETQAHKRSSMPLHKEESIERWRTSPAHGSAGSKEEMHQLKETIGMNTLLTIPQVAQQLNICRAHVYKLINQGLPTIHLGRSVRISATSLYTWLSTHEHIQ
jgi:excisionase family DNA binding protein